MGQVLLRTEPTKTEAEVLSDSLVEKIQLWQRRWNLKDRWVGQFASDSVLLWAAGSCPLDEWPLEVELLEATLGAQENDFRLIVDGWRPLSESRRIYEEGALIDFKDKLKDYLDEIEERVIARGWGRAPERRKFEHFEWLAQYQVMRSSYVQIWRSLSSLDRRGDPRTSRASFVEKACKRLAREIGLTLR
jgi:hypothetical protein